MRGLDVLNMDPDRSIPRSIRHNRIIQDIRPLRVPILYELFFHACFLAASVFLNGNPVVLLSAPVFRLIFPLLLAKSTHQRPMAATTEYAIIPIAKAM